MLTLLNAAPDTGNQGVTALCLSALAGLQARGAGPVTVADHGRGRRRADLGPATVGLIGLSHSRRLWRSEALTTVHLLSRIGGGFSATARAIAASRAILDVSGGDSFTDLYGPRRFAAMTLTKRLALDNGIPLILLPQTLGPFRDRDRRAQALSILRRAHAIWLRDAESFAFLADALGADFDPTRHHLGLDMAVALPQARPTAPLPDPLPGWLSPRRGHALAGLNVSGLLYSNAAQAQARFGLADRHDIQIEAAARAILAVDPHLRLLLIPHVHRPAGDPESDHDAALMLRERLGARLAHRIAVVPAGLSAMELKWLIARLDWFAGARMHATIAAFSSGVPTLALGYSDKAAGVFARCGLADHVADLRQMDTPALVTAVSRALVQRHGTRAHLARLLPDLLDQAEAQMDAIARTLAALPARAKTSPFA